MKVEEMSHYRLLEPADTKTIGHGEAPEALVIEIDGDRYELEYGTVYRASKQCDPDNRVANLDRDPPLLRCRIIETYSDQFEQVGD